MVSCANVTKDDTSYCCNGAENCCDSGDGRFSVGPHNPTTSAIWNAAIDRVIVKEWLKDPKDNGGSDSGGVCLPTQGDFNGPTQTQQGSGADDGTYTHASTPRESHAEIWIGDTVSSCCLPFENKTIH